MSHFITSYIYFNFFKVDLLISVILYRRAQTKPRFLSTDCLIRWVALVASQQNFHSSSLTKGLTPLTKKPLNYSATFALSLPGIEFHGFDHWIWLEGIGFIAFSFNLFPQDLMFPFSLPIGVCGSVCAFNCLFVIKW